MGKLTNAQLLGSWTGGYDVHSWDPTKVSPDAVEKLPIVVKQAPRSANAWLDYNKLYADGKLLVGAQFGWDYNAGRADLANAAQKRAAREQRFHLVVGVHHLAACE